MTLAVLTVTTASPSDEIVPVRVALYIEAQRVLCSEQETQSRCCRVQFNSYFTRSIRLSRESVRSSVSQNLFGQGYGLLV